MSVKHTSRLRLTRKVRKMIQLGRASKDPLANKCADVLERLSIIKPIKNRH